MGGAHVKAARVDQARVVAAMQLPCPLWQGLEYLDAAMDDVLARLGPAPRHAITMTGEMVDLFASRAEGVAALVAAAAKKLGAGNVRIFAGDAGFVAAHEAAQHWHGIASANWLATAMLLAAKLPQALLVDIGSTTTDVVPVKDGKVLAQGRSDSQRLVHDELVYTGIVRTPLMAVTATVEFEGQSQNVMAELFATMADAYRVASRLPEDADDFPAADQGEKTVPESARRLARMLGRDAESAPLEVWRRLAETFIELQTIRIEKACERVLERANLIADAPFVGAGCGRFVAESVARRLARPYRDFADLVPADPAARHWASVCAPAVAVACLAAGV